MAQGATRRARKPAEENPADIQAQIQALAYHLWLQRGAPIGSPEQDWFEAEARFTRDEEAKVAD